MVGFAIFAVTKLQTKMSNENAMPFETVSALDLGKILANQDEIMKMLAEIMANDTNRNKNEIYDFHVKEARASIPKYMDDFLGRLKKAKDRSPLQ